MFSHNFLNSFNYICCHLCRICILSHSIGINSLQLKYVLLNYCSLFIKQNILANTNSRNTISLDLKRTARMCLYCYVFRECIRQSIFPMQNFNMSPISQTLKTSGSCLWCREMNFISIFDSFRAFRFGTRPHRALPSPVTLPYHHPTPSPPFVLPKGHIYPTHSLYMQSISKL